jgi:D-threonate/D-erythronate kinase
MIAVVADDFSGAAEIGAVGWQHGLKTVVTTDHRVDLDADLIVVDTNSRSGSRADARTLVLALATVLAEAKPEWIFKKTDSVLRGHILTEVDALLEGLGRSRAVLVPANPSLGRTMRGGEYFVGSQPLHFTAFSEDEEYPARTSRVLDLLGADGPRVRHASCPGEPGPDPGILVGDAAAATDLACWAAAVGDGIIPGGGADFFAALLAARLFQPVPRSDESMRTYAERSGLYLVGSRTPASRISIGRLEELGFVMPPEAANGASRSDEEWADRLADHLSRFSRVVVTSGALDQGSAGSGDPGRLVRVARLVLDRLPVQEVIVEGGSTASQLVRALDWHSFLPVTELGRGIVRMAVLHHDDVHVTVKPGSYLWPATDVTVPGATALS